MTPEIKAAIKKEAEKHISVPFHQLASTQKCYPMNLEIRGYDFTAGAEYGYKLGYIMGKIDSDCEDEIKEMRKKELQEILGE